jgi:hypothetical protein
MVKRTEVLHDEFSLERKYGVLHEHCARYGEHNIINTKQQVYRIGATAEDEQVGVRLGLNKCQSEEVHGEPVVPSPGHQLQPVERLVEAADPVRLRGINKTRQLVAVDCLRESTILQHVLHIKQMDRPGIGDSQRKHHADSGRLDHRAEGLIIVDAEPLGKAAKDPTTLVPLHGAVGVELVLEDPFIGDDVGANRMRDKIPSIVGDQTIIFFLHVVVPGWIGKDGAEGGGHRRE